MTRWRRPRGRPCGSRSTAVRTVKSPGRTCSSSSQVTGNDTGTPGRARGLYAATTVAPPALVESTNTLPPRSSRTNSVVATPGSSRAARAASGPGRRRDVRDLGVLAQRHEHVHALGAAGLDATRQPGVLERLPDQQRGRHRHPEPVQRFDVVRRVEVEDQVGLPVAVHAHQRRVVLDRPLVGQPHQGPPVVADRVVHLALGGVRPHRRGPDPVGGVLRQVLLHERLLAEPGPHDGQRAVAELREHPLVHGVQIRDQVALGRAGAVEDRLVEVRERDTGQRRRVLRAFRHGSSLPGVAVANPAVSVTGPLAGRDTRRP